MTMNCFSCCKPIKGRDHSYENEDYIYMNKNAQAQGKVSTGTFEAKEVDYLEKCTKDCTFNIFWFGNLKQHRNRHNSHTGCRQKHNHNDFMDGSSISDGSIDSSTGTLIILQRRGEK